MGKRFIHNKKGKINIIFLSLFAGIAGGLAVLIVVIGVMNGFQNNYITRRVEIGSYHAEITKEEGIKTYREFISQIYHNCPEVEAAVPYSDREVIILFKNKIDSDRQPVKLRAVMLSEIGKDTAFMNLLQINHGKMDLEGSGILLGEELGWRELSFARIGSEVFLTPDISLRSITSNETEPFEVRGYFNTGSYDYDRYWAFISLESFQILTGIDSADNIGIKFKKGVNRKKAVEKLARFLNDPSYSVKSAEETNRAYFSALKLEKTMILFLFAVIFLMVGTNIFGTLKLTILEKKESILILKALGSKPADIGTIFLLESVILAFGGGFTGLFIGIFISHNILNIFTAAEIIINFFLRIALPAEVFQPVKIYDTSIYYQTDFLVKFTFTELSGMFFSVVLLTVLSAYLPVSKAAKMRPNEILRGNL